VPCEAGFDERERFCYSGAMMRPLLPCCLALALLACAGRSPKPAAAATWPQATVRLPQLPTASDTPPPATTANVNIKPNAAQPSEAAPETRSHLPPVNLETVPLAVAKANFVRDTAARYGLDAAFIEATLAKAQVRQPIINAIARPAERAKPWHEYRPLFISTARIEGGKRFLAQHRQALERVQAQSGVPAEIIVAIIGIETHYGANTGNYRVLDALYTLAFYYPRSGEAGQLEREVRRELFFREELAQLFDLVQREGLDIHTLKGSYAGAMGMGQFMPSSYLDYAVDGDGDGRRDLFTNYADIFASIANYFVKKGGWVRGGVIAVPAHLAAGFEEFNPSDWTPRYRLDELARRGYTPHMQLQATHATATPVNLEGANGKQYWLGFQNYYAITRYNISKMYAMAVFQLSAAIAGEELPPA